MTQDLQEHRHQKIDASGSLKGRSILIVEDEPLIAMDVALALEHTGVAITATNTLHHALLLVQYDGLSGAIVDHGLGDGNSTSLCTRLTQRGIPFLIYSGFPFDPVACGAAPYLSKPASPDVLTKAVVEMILGPETVT